MESEFLTYWAKGGSPRIFGLDDFSKPVVVFSERVVEIWADFRAVFTHDQLSPELKMEKTEQIILRTMAEMSLALVDDPSLPTQLAMAAAKLCPGLQFMPNDLATLEYEARGLGYMNCWFFAFAHELGHFQPMGFPETWRELAQSELIASINGLQKLQKSYRDEIIAQIQGGRTGPLLDTRQILTEALADTFAMIILFESAMPIMKDAGQFEQFSIEGFYYEAILSLNFVATLGQIEHVVRARRHGVVDWQTALEQSVFRGVIGARANVAFHFFRMYLNSKYPDAEAFDQEIQTETLERIAQHVESDIIAWDRGFAAATTTLFSLPMPCDVRTFLDRLNALSDTSEVRHLTNFANAAQKTSWHFRALERKVAEPQKKIAFEELEIESKGLLYLIATLEADDKGSVPACLHTGEDSVCFVFHTRVLFDDFVALLRRMLGDQIKVKTVALQVAGEEGVFEQIGMWLRPHVHAQVLIQGSEAFDRQYLQLLDQTEQIGKIGVFLP